jgi:hypothetical protein
LKSRAGLCPSDRRGKRNHHTGRQTTSDDLLIDTDFIEEYTAALYIMGKNEYFSR